MFYVIDQGNRVQTPLDRLLPQQDISEVSAIGRTRAINQRDTQVKDRPEKSATQETEKKIYDQIEHTRQRKPVVYAHQIMTSPVVTASIHLQLEAIWRLFSKQGCHHLPLVDEQQHIQGIVSDRDLLRFAANNERKFGSVAIHQLMTRRVITATGQTEVRTLAEVMCQRSIGAVPIEDDAHNLVGIVSRSDILRTLVNHGPLELWA